MIFKNIFLGSVLFLAISTPSLAQKKMMGKLIKQDFAFADSQYRLMAKSLPNQYMPQRFDFKQNKIVSLEDSSWWCVGFYPGTLWYIYEQTKDSVIRKEAERALAFIEPNKYYTGNHDVGFMMFNSFGNAYRITGDTAYKNVIFTSAASLSKRYIPHIKAIQSWGDYKKSKVAQVIIDNMLNLELLNWVSQNGGDAKYGQIAINHANTTKANHFRPDYSSYHVVEYDKTTGNVVKKRTAQGYSDASSWARGQGWGLYGYTMMYRFTHDTAYLNQARHIANFILTNPTLPKDKIPYWDFNDPKIPNVPRDASAGALIASGLLELAQYTEGKERKNYIKNAGQMLVTLSSPAFRVPLGTTGGFLLLHSTGNLPGKSEVDVPIIYADYYFLEALKRYKDWYLK